MSRDPGGAIIDRSGAKPWRLGGHPMTPSTAKKGSIRYRYYVSSMLAQGRRSEAGTIARVSAPEIEAVVVDALRAAYPGDAALEDRALTQSRIERVVLRAGSMVMHPTSDPASPIKIAWSPPPPRGRREILASRGSEGHDRGISGSPNRAAALGCAWEPMAG